MKGQYLGPEEKGMKAWEDKSSRFLGSNRRGSKSWGEESVWVRSKKKPASSEETLKDQPYMWVCPDSRVVMCPINTDQTDGTFRIMNSGVLFKIFPFF